MTYPDDYDERKETVQAYVDRHLTDEMEIEAKEWSNSVLYGVESGDVRGILPSGSDDRDLSYMEYEGFTTSPMVFDEVAWERINEAFNSIGRGFQEWAKKISKTMEIWYPAISEAHRAEVKRVRTAYRQKKGKRW